MVEKTVDVEAMVSLHLLSGTREMDFRFPRGYRTSVKKDKDDSNWEYRNGDKDKGKAKSYNRFANNQPPTQASKKDKRYRNRQGHPITEVNVTEVSKKNKDKDKAKNLSYIKCYTCKQKGHYANKYPEKSKN